MQLEALKYALRRTLSMILLALTMATSALACEHLSQGTPKQSSFVDCRVGYAVGYDYELKSAEWVAYKLEREDYVEVARQDDFREDEEIPREFRTRPSDYVEPVYDTGHLASSESLDESILENSETFLMSNMTPQLPGFNRAIWKGLENKERRLAEQYGIAWVYAGPIYTAPIRHIGRAPIPTAFFKVIYYSDKVEAYLIPHLKLKTAQLNNYKVPVESVEAVTGLDL